MNGSKQHYLLLDGMRGVAALMVLGYHLFEAVAFAADAPEQQMYHGFLAVDFFLVLSGYTIERLFKMTDFSREDGIRRFARQLRAMGVDEELRKRGAENGACTEDYSEKIQNISVGIYFYKLRRHDFLSWSKKNIKTTQTH